MSRYESLNHVPRGFRMLEGSPLSLDQVNEIVGRAEALSTGPEDFALSLGKAKAEFKEANVQADGLWVGKAKE